MAKPVHKNQLQFYETLKKAPRVLKQPVMLQPISANNMSINALPLGGEVWNDLSAGLHDAGLVIGGIKRTLTGTWARALYIVMALSMLIGGSVTAVRVADQTLKKYGPSLSNPSIIMNTKNTGTTILDRNGVVLYRGYGAVDRRIISIDEMPATLKQATLATEDPDFYQHSGFSLRSTARAAYEDLLQTRKAQGGSTISQQLVKTTLLSSEKSFTRKYQEVILSSKMESDYTKDQILQMYLNTIYYGEGAYGAQAAAQTYFNKPSKDLTLGESALLAGLPQSPSRFDPNVNLEAATDRRNYVLDRMQEQGYVSQQQADIAKAEPVVVSQRTIEIKAPHFVFYVLDELRRAYGEDTIEKGGITVHTSLDYAKQVEGERIVREQVLSLSDHHATNGGLVSLDTHTGDIITMVGSIGFDEPGFGNVNVTLAELQPGSSFKPIAYAAAFTKGWNGATKVDDKPLSVAQSNGTVYAPQNYDQKFRGPVLLRRALANSLNIPAVEVLQYAGIHDTIAMAHSLGITEPSLVDESRYGLSLVLGGGEVRPIDMAAVYAALANQGRTVTPRAITSVDDRFGQDISKPAPKTNTQVLDPRVAFMLTNILSDTKARQEEFGPNNPLALSRPAAAKTGTTNDFRDNWTVGYTPDLVTAVWVGNNDHTAMNNVDGITGAAPIWHNYMEMALANTPIHDFTIPTGVVFVRICQADGGLAEANDASSVNEVFLAEAVPTKRCGSIGGGAQVAPAATPAPVPLGQQQTPSPEQAVGPAPTGGGGRGGGGGGNTTPGDGGNTPPSGGGGGNAPPSGTPTTP